MSEKDPMITNVPGMPVPVTREGDRAPMTLTEFKGDPSHVLDHPANPTTEMTQAYAEQLNNPATPNASKEVGAVAVGSGPELISQVPGMPTPEAPQK